MSCEDYIVRIKYMGNEIDFRGENLGMFESAGLYLQSLLKKYKFKTRSEKKFKKVAEFTFELLTSREFEHLGYDVVRCWDSQIGYVYIIDFDKMTATGYSLIPNWDDFWEFEKGVIESVDIMMIKWEY